MSAQGTSLNDFVLRIRTVFFYCRIRMIIIVNPIISAFTFFAALVIGGIEVFPFIWARTVMIFIFCGAVATGTAYGALVGIGIIRTLIDLPITIGQGMICIFRCAVAAGAAYGSAVLAVAGRSPGTVSQRMVCVLIGAVAAGGTGYRSSMLCVTVLCPGAVGEAVIRIRSGTDITVAGGAIAAVFMLRGAVFRVLGCGGMVSVGVRTLTAIGAGVITAVAGAVVILPCTIRIASMARAGVHQLIAVITVFIPVTARPFSIGVAMACTGTEVLAAVRTILIIITTGPGIIGGVMITGSISSAYITASAAGTVIISALGTNTVTERMVFTENTATLVISAVGTPMTDAVYILCPVFIVQRVAVSAVAV